ncbi:hypothetical protein, partial [Komagataeibacter oboediens]|uniref:hypothetical protein n=1 Tax=Komagataeibacter oboediens TaxID=65958 RepID=UPI001F27FE86
GRQKWRKPYFQIRSPVGVHRQLPLQLVFHESPIASVGNPYSKFSAKVVLEEGGAITTLLAFAAPLKARCNYHPSCSAQSLQKIVRLSLFLGEGLSL